MERALLKSMLATLVCTFVVASVLVPPCSAARTLRDSDRSLAEAQDEFERQSSNWSGRESGDDVVPTFSNAGKQKEWVRFQKELVSIESDYEDTVAVANPSPVFDPTAP